jgi:hypothetical protein
MSVNAGQGKRRVPSALLGKLRQERMEALKALGPGERMETAFTQSLEALNVSLAGLRAQGFSESEIRDLLKAKSR